MVLAIIEHCKSLLEKTLYPFAQELNELDWKEDLSGNHEKLKRHLSAFANYPNGGYIVFGIEDLTGKLSNITQEQSEKISSLLSNFARQGLTPSITTNFFFLEFRSYHLFVCYISESSEKPVYVMRQGGIIDAPFIRAGGTTRAMTREDIRYSTLHSRHARYEEMQAMLSSEVEENWTEYFDFSQIQSRLKQTTFTSSENYFEFLYNLKLLIKVQNKFLPTNLALITCAKDFSKFQNYEKLEIRILTYKGLNKFSVKSDQSYSQGYSICLDHVVNEIMKQLPTNEIFKSATRHTIASIPEVVIRELISNAIIHRDYGVNNSQLLVEIYDNRIEITNPGNLISDVEVDRLIDHPSKTRNEILANFMRNLGFAEERGSGIDKAVGACEEYGLPALKFINEKDYFRAVAYVQKKFNDMDKDERREAVYQHACLNYVTTNKTTNKSIRERFKFSEKEITKATRLISDVLLSEKIKLADKEAAKKDYNYIPYWA